MSDVESGKPWTSSEPDATSAGVSAHNVEQEDIQIFDADEEESIEAASDPDIEVLAGLNSSTSGVIGSDGSGWIVKTFTQLKSSLSLNLVNNTADADKPISSAAQTALNAKQTLDSDLTAIGGLSPTNDDVLQRKSGAWTSRSMAQVKTDLTLAKADVGLANVDNTADSAKPVSTAAQTALDGKQNLDADLTAVAGLDSSQSGAIVSDGAGWIRKTYAQLKTALSLSKTDIGLAGGTVTLSGNGVLTAFTIAHGLSGTPSGWALTPTSVVAAAAMYSAVDSTNITVTFLVAPALGTDNVGLVWMAIL